MKKLLWLLFGMILIAAIVPHRLATAEYEVAITWSIRENSPSDHIVDISGKTFSIPAGGSSVQTHALRGGQSDRIIFATRGWGFLGQTIKIDGEEIPLDLIRTSKITGTIEVFGLSKRPTMNAELDITKLSNKRMPNNR